MRGRITQHCKHNIARGRALSVTLEELDTRLSRLEDRREIEQLIASYGPAVDTLDAAGIAALWTADGSYGIGPDVILSGAQEVAGIATLDQHQGYVRQGCAHILSPHRIDIDGTEATARGYSIVLLHDAATGQWRIERASANRWRLRKGATGWQTVHRQADLLDGAETARALLGWAEPTGATR
ncbi:nuclear transport factor 2 family protein [Thalassorhabdomicrobium marinisediminis]|nr:nuclear transport factor 2 family protein [Thalassorhabdomicrobium marinisediminis]